MKGRHVLAASSNAGFSNGLAAKFAEAVNYRVWAAAI